MSSGSDGLFQSPLSDILPAMSDCLEPYFSVFFPIIACVFFIDFSGYFYFSLIFHDMYPFLGSSFVISLFTSHKYDAS